MWVDPPDGRKWEGVGRGCPPGAWDTDVVNDPQIGHACGVFGVYAPGQGVAHLTYLGATAHRPEADPTLVFDSDRVPRIGGWLACGPEFGISSRYSGDARIGVPRIWSGVGRSSLRCPIWI